MFDSKEYGVLDDGMPKIVQEDNPLLKSLLYRDMF